MESISRKLSSLIIFCSFLFGNTDVNHFIVYFNGETESVLIDSLNEDWIYYKLNLSEESKVVSTEKVYFIFNDFNRMYYYGWHLKTNIDRIEHRSGRLITTNNDTIPYRDIQFNRHMIKPEMLVTSPSDTAFYVNFLDIRKLESDFSILEYGAQRGFVWSSSLFFLFKGFSSDFVPQLSLIGIDSTGSTYPWVSYMVPLSVYGTMVWDYYFNKNTIYFNPTMENVLFGRSMYIFSLSHMIKSKSMRIWRRFSKSNFGQKVLYILNRKNP
ncbi:MAG: hypothetical protein ISR83_05065 [Candidatus Marinimicrobia bacterium]|nr:hypothetical protein [Candidatus Neomarinimicrobiota bacterium]